MAALFERKANKLFAVIKGLIANTSPGRSFSHRLPIFFLSRSEDPDTPPGDHYLAIDPEAEKDRSSGRGSSRVCLTRRRSKRSSQQWRVHRAIERCTATCGRTGAFSEFEKVFFFALCCGFHPEGA